MPINYSDVLSRNIRMREAQREKLNKEMGHKMFQTTPLAMQLGGYVKDVVTGQIAKRGMENFADISTRAQQGDESAQREFMTLLSGMGAGTIGKASKVFKNDLVVANKYEGGIVSGKRGELHFAVMSKDKGKLLESGFTDSKGNFYSRDEALEYIKESVPNVKGMDETVSARYHGLDAKDLNFARTGDYLPLETLQNNRDRKLLEELLK